MKNLILWLWQFPQNLLGFIIIKLCKAKRYWQFTRIYTCHLFYAGASLGKYIIFDDRRLVDDNDVKHEIGHQKQSLYLGWFYLTIIGIPSVIGNILYRIKKFNYYNQPWEKWADKLGNVKR